jgi:high-affinity Fe2+/Pb2+ permease
MGTIASGALAIAMLAAFLLIAGGIRLIRRGEFRKQGWLMVIAALVLVGNVLVLTV